MDVVPPSEHLCYVHCTYCNTVLAVGVPCKRLMDTVTVKCGHCNHLSLINPKPLVQHTCSSEHQMGFQGHCNDCSKKHQLLLPSSSTSCQQVMPKPPFVVKPPEKKHRLPSAYNRFMKEEIQRLKTAEPDIPHREAFSMAAKNWAKCVPRATIASTAENNGTARTISIQHEKLPNGFLLESFDALKQVDKN